MFDSINLKDVQDFKQWLNKDQLANYHSQSPNPKKIKNSKQTKKQKQKQKSIIKNGSKLQHNISKSNNQIQIPPKIKQKVQEYQQNTKGQKVQSKIKRQSNKPSTSNSNSRIVKKIVVQNKKTNEKISLGQKLNKKMAEYNINKVGPSKKSNKNKKVSPNKLKNQQNNQNVQEQIHIQEQTEEQVQEEILNQEIQQQQIPEQTFISQKNESSRIQQIKQPLKLKQKVNPFQFIKKQQTQNKSSISSSNIEPNIQKFETQKAKSQFKQQKIVNAKEQIQSHYIQKPKISYVSQSIILNNSKREQNQKIKEDHKQLQQIMSKIYNLSPEKLLKLQKVLDHMDQQQIQNEVPNRSQSSLTTESHIIRNQTQLNDHQSQIQISKNKVHVPIGEYYSKQRDSFKKNNKDKKQKASTIFNHSKSASRIKIKLDSLDEQTKNQDVNKVNQIINVSKFSSNNSNLLLSQGKPLKIQKINFKKVEKVQESKENLKNNQIQTNKNQQQIFLVNNNVSQLKLINLGNKKASNISKNPIQQKITITYKQSMQQGFEFPKQQKKIPSFNESIRNQKIIQEQEKQKQAIRKHLLQIQNQQKLINNSKFNKPHSISQMRKINENRSYSKLQANQLKNSLIEQSNNGGRLNNMRIPKNKIAQNNQSNKMPINLSSKQKQPLFQNKIDKGKSLSKIKHIDQSNKYDQFDSMLKGFEQDLNRNKSKSKVSNPVIGFSSKNSINSIIQKQTQNKNKILQNKSDDFMNDSLFQQKPKPQRIISAFKRQPIKQEPQKMMQQNKIQQKNYSKVQKSKNSINIDDFLCQLDDVIHKDKATYKKINISQNEIIIPNLPSGSTFQIEIYQNWGHSAFVGLQSIQFFNQNGQIILPVQIKSNKAQNNVDLIKALTKKNIINNDEKSQAKLGFDKGNITNLQFKFSKPIIFSMIRVWNYNSNRIHSNIGIKFCLFKIDQIGVFMGQIRKSQSTPQNFYKFCEPILFTNDKSIISKINKNDCLYQYKKKLKQQQNLFKSTLKNFNRPKTKNNQQKQINTSKIHQNKPLNRQIKLPKRNCWEYQPPQLPQGNLLVFILHDTWGDKNFIGLNGLQIFDEKGSIINKQNIVKIKAFPPSTGETNDKRVIQNLLNGNNYNHSDKNIWLATYQSDLQKMQSRSANTIFVQLSKKSKISGINIFNYSKTPERGVKQIQIQMNNFILFRGYAKIYDQKNKQAPIHTTINFTKEIKVLEKINYNGYNEDNFQQNINFINQKKYIKV